MKFESLKEEGRVPLGEPNYTAIACALLRKITNSPCVAWRTEALRLFAEFQRTQNVRHLRAFVRHCKGVEARFGVSCTALALPR